MTFETKLLSRTLGDERREIARVLQSFASFNEKRWCVQNKDGSCIGRGFLDLVLINFVRLSQLQTVWDKFNLIAFFLFDVDGMYSYLKKTAGDPVVGHGIPDF